MLLWIEIMTHFHKQHPVMLFVWFSDRKEELSSHDKPYLRLLIMGMTHVWLSDTCIHCPILLVAFHHILHRDMCNMWSPPISVRLMRGRALQELKRMIDAACQRGNSGVLMRCVNNIEFCCHKIERMAPCLGQKRVTVFSFSFWDLIWEWNYGQKVGKISLEMVCWFLSL